MEKLISDFLKGEWSRNCRDAKHTMERFKEWMKIEQAARGQSGATTMVSLPPEIPEYDYDIQFESWWLGLQNGKRLRSKSPKYSAWAGWCAQKREYMIREAS